MMPFLEDLLSVLRRGWETSRRAWRLLTPKPETTFSPADIGATGPEMEQLAYDLRRLGHARPARMASSVAGVLNGLADETIPFDSELADKTSQIVVTLAEMLLELEATSRITADEPADIVQQLRSRFGLIVFEDQPAPAPPDPHFRRPAGSPAAASADLIAVSEELVRASESLLKRVLREGEFPHTAALSRIHHLGTTIRNHFNGVPLPVAPPRRGLVPPLPPPARLRPLSTAAVQAGPIASKPVEPSVPADSESVPQVIEQVDVPIQAETTAETIPPPVPAAPSPLIETGTACDELLREPLTDRRPRVLIIDDSPFFRLLLTTAVESAGYAARAVPDLVESQAMSDAQSWNLVICDAREFAPAATTRAWLTDRLTAWNASVIALTSKSPEPRDSFGEGIDGTAIAQVRRTDLATLLALVKSTLAPTATAA